MSEKKPRGTANTRNSENQESKKVLRFHLCTGGSSKNPEKYAVIPMHRSDRTIADNSFSIVHSSGFEKYFMLFKILINPNRGIATIKQ
jgi:hypothetical protein